MRALFKQVQGEVPGSPIFIMKVASQVRPFPCVLNIEILERPIVNHLLVFVTDMFTVQGQSWNTCLIFKTYNYTF